MSIGIHWHVIPEEGAAAMPAYCTEHAPTDVRLYECWSSRCTCVVCDEEQLCLLATHAA